uniref:Uncharacterized protein n=1 Tax=Panagrolaimus superbus TaxID=310955 RepID=A0A914Y007_9BILA
MRILRLPVTGAGVYFRHPLVPVRRRATADLVRQRLYHQSAAGTVNHDLRCTKYSPEHPGKSVIRSGNDGTARGVNCPALRICRSAREATDGYRAETGAGGSRNILRQIFGYCLMEKRLPSGAGASCLASTGTGGNRYRYRRHLRRHCDGVTGKKNMAYPRHAGREQLDRAEGIMR